MFISQMEDDHLRNMIHLLISDLKDAITIFSADKNIPQYKLAIYGLTLDEVQESMGRKVPAVLGKLYPYLAEAFLRDLDGIEKIRVLLREALGRSSRETMSLPTSRSGILPEPHWDMDPEEPIDDDDDIPL